MPTILVLQQVVSRYTADITLVIEDLNAGDALDQRPIYRSLLTEAIMRTQVAIIQSSTLARRAVEELRLSEYPEFNPALRQPRPVADFVKSLNPFQRLAELSGGEEESAGGQDSSTAEDRELVRLAEAFRSRLDVQMNRNAFVIGIRFTAEDPVLAAKAANTIAELFVLDRLEASLDDARQVSEWLSERLVVLRDDVAVAESAAEQFRAEHGLRRKGTGQITVVDQQVLEVNTRLVFARSELAQKQARFQQMEAVVRSQGALETTSAVLQSPLVQRLREQEAALLRQISEASKTYADRHPRMVAMKADLEQLRGKIAAEMQKVVVSMRNDVEVARADVRALEAELAALRSEGDVAGEADLRLRELERQAEASRELYEAFLARFKRTTDQNRIQRANARVISPAEVPRAPSAPRKNLIIFTMSIMALVAGVALVMVIDRLDNTVRSSDESEEITGLPTVAIIPSMRGKADRLIRQVLERPRSQLADAVRTLKTSLDLDMTRREGEASTVVVTSSVPKEGKTFVTLGLALMCSKTKERVLLIDGDMHRPRLHTILECSNETGLVQILSGVATADDVIQRDVMPNLDFLPAGSLEDVADLISESRAEAVIGELAPKYDRIIIDSAPALAVADARLLGRVADRVIYLVRWGTTPRDAVRSGIKLLRQAGVPLHGVVLSQVNQKKHARYAYGDYGQYYGRYRGYYAD
ncbi:polysaccharide biosynthesis tyrosine autokinase (plasmid) [Thalassobaculum sp. OXR-137]|uniref:polysaccharide biosynthesis tyrosine autokinase n=1 Tax=Thalassobaculum sp. OXR-137 TaxID=3100173 RepID=UPI002AC8A261|nr:polysaccharide biosynthesis tyrosine autokinase [Thalassobaculum sp. OXR-137]WPZ37233.1 polysaccharide biosynthesis tyrosine autokinase [Thalassobaculum sp. OXR-137]